MSGRRGDDNEYGYDHGYGYGVGSGNDTGTGPVQSGDYNKRESGSYDDADSSRDDKRQCNDVFFLLGWLAVTIMVVYFAIAYGQDFLQATQIQNFTESTGFKVLFKSVINSTFAAMGMSVVWIAIMILVGEFLIWVALIGVILLNIACAYFFTKYGKDRGYSFYYWPAIIFGLSALLLAMYTLCIRKRIKFAAAHLKVAGTAVFQLPMTLAIALVVVLLHVGWAAAWVIGTAGVLFHQEYVKLSDVCTAEDCNVTMVAGTVLGITFGLLVVFFWGSFVLKNIVAVTVAGTVAAWKNASSAAFITMSACLRAVTLNLGSICFGSLIVAILEAVQTILNVLASISNQSGNCVGACVYSCIACIIGCIEGWIEFFNRFAYTYVGIYGYSFVTASRHVFKLFAAKGWSAIVNDNLTDIVFFLGNIVVGAMTAFIAIKQVDDEQHLVGMFQHPEAIVGFFAFVVGYATNNLFMSVIASAVTTVFVLWAEDPHGWQMTRPEAYDSLHSAWHRIYPEEYNDGYGKQLDDRA